MKEKLTRLFKSVVNAYDLASARSLVVEFLTDNDLTGVPKPKYNVTIILGEREASIHSNDYCQIACYLAQGKKIAAIKQLRAITGAGLKESKFAVENSQNWLIPSQT